jgi:hypothetical protein
MKTEKLSGIVTSLQRLKNSKNGNPRYQFVIAGKIVTTKVDAMAGYAIANYENKFLECEVRILRGVLSLESILNSWK